MVKLPVFKEKKYSLGGRHNITWVESSDHLIFNLLKFTDLKLYKIQI